ncbi:hypothetical protein BO70DRAFT_328931 [Aspergillus heteromorphus CBS 117.55]|uniref:SRR1-like domain-containing protein n=1 Tax=Aspergillus heteromorphus CBS 117.55 TaxID=1448321 RepID=A0A317WWU5_9EURO|nr:uncharacterized protein BO70DRAFT_328931 [Aspergillus heteromorphus CBS 117.55]PWY90876.1 hypothetical protein BO70DRAFT_328931 [Aspergillus heteromorphus CBS 117.55]
MPHSSRKKPSPSNHKRQQITDSSGWTHVTTNQNARRCARTTSTTSSPNSNSNPNPNPNSHPQKHQTQQQQQQQQQQEQQQEQQAITLHPASAPPNLTLPDLQSQLTHYTRKYASSATSRAVTETLCGQRALLQSVDNIVCIGLGSLSGLLRGGWVDRRNVSLFQLAALVGVGGCFVDQPPKPPTPTYAQDPVFNTLDTTLLTTLSITVLSHPHAFKKVTPNTLLFCPGAERTHLEQLLVHKPAIVFGGPLEDVESEVIQGFVRERASTRLPVFEELEAAFWGMRVYYRVDVEEED